MSAFILRAMNSSSSSAINPQQDIRIGTLVQANGGAEATANYIRQILPHGFESFQLMFWEKIGDVDLDETAKRVLDACGDKATISSIGVFGNPLQNEETARDFGRALQSVKSFGGDIVAGFAGALEDRSVDDNLPRAREVWSKLAKIAEDNGTRIAWENCDMGGTWEAPKWNIAHSPTAWEKLFNEIPSEALGLEWEPCHQMNSLVDPLPQLREWMPKVFHLHGKDATVAWDVVRKYGTRSGRAYVWHRTPGFGDTNWTDIISMLRQNGFKGAIDIEGWHDPVYNGELEMTGQVHGLNYLKKCRGGDFVPNPA
jgi:sugar phosphate isomerase/epimerase